MESDNDDETFRHIGHAAWRAFQTIAKDRTAIRSLASEQIPTDTHNRADDVDRQRGQDGRREIGRLALYGIRLVKARNHRRL